MNVMITAYCGERAIARKVKDAGHTPVFVSHRLYDNYRKVKETCDAVILSGGEDVHPGIYLEKPTFTKNWNIARDLFEGEILDYALNIRKIKLLGICRGCQFINAYMGGSLYQDMTEAGFNHNGSHDLTLYEYGNELFDYSDFITTNSYHHQSIKVVAPDFKVIARHRDKTVEGIYSEKYNCLGVQWHPEWMDTTQEVFTWLTS